MHKISQFLRSIFLSVPFEKHQRQAKPDCQDNLTTVFLNSSRCDRPDAKQSQILTLNLKFNTLPITL
ncbi:hypothetical protein QUB05_03915 [Microcoleus sp. F10-C6]|uniref:hypothetical protein n=1 Tax=unclassified Microcoleus TaxID=2642155 RepID=UPI002FD467E2